MFHLQTGSYRALEQAFLDALLAQKQGDPLAGILVISPSGHLLDHLQRRLTDGATEQGSMGGDFSNYSGPSSGLPQPPSPRAPSFLNIHCLTFYALAERL